MARFHSLFPSFHPFPRHRPTTLSFHRSDFLLLVSTDVVPIYIRAGRYRKSNFVTSHQPGQDSAPLFRRNYTLAESRSLERFSLIKPTLPPKSAPLLHFCATERRQNSFSDSKTFPPLSLPLSLRILCSISAGKLTSFPRIVNFIYRVTGGRMERVVVPGLFRLARPILLSLGAFNWPPLDSRIVTDFLPDLYGNFRWMFL